MVKWNFNDIHESLIKDLRNIQRWKKVQRVFKFDEAFKWTRAANEFIIIRAVEELIIFAYHYYVI